MTGLSIGAALALARLLARFHSGAESVMIRLDMPEYQEAHSVARLRRLRVGGPPAGQVADHTLLSGPAR